MTATVAGIASVIRTRTAQPIKPGSNAQPGVPQNGIGGAPKPAPAPQPQNGGQK